MRKMSDKTGLSDMNDSRRMRRFCGLKVVKSAAGRYTGQDPRITPIPDLMPLTAVPAWARATAIPTNETDAAFLAGAGLALLHSVITDAPPWQGVWLQRLALRAAAACVSARGRQEDERALRDAFYLRQTGADPGPAGRLLVLWRRLAGRSPALDEERIRVAAADLDVPMADACRDIADQARMLAEGSRPAVVAAAEAAALCVRVRPDADILGLWLADAVLASRLRWPVPLPLIAAVLLQPQFRLGPQRRRPRPGEPDWSHLCSAAYAQAAGQACDLAIDLSRRATTLQSVVPRLRAKGAAAVIEALLSDDAVAASARIAGMSDRALRRIFERLVDLGAVRELTGRPTFRLFGL
jgi:hypothetical protein